MSVPALPATMTAVVHDVYGGPEVLRVEQVPVPTIGDRDVLVRVHAASLNYADWGILHGDPLMLRLVFGLRGPKVRVRGRDVAGVVEAVGPAVSSLRVGDAVYGEIDSGSFAEYAAVPEKHVSPMPSTLTFAQAATVPLAGGTALQALAEAGRLQPGQRVLINGASGGVGSWAVQIAAILGAEVTAVCSARNAARARARGAEHVVDYARTDFTRAGARYEFILDLVGNHSLTALRGALTERGTLVLSSGRGGRVLGPVGRLLRASALNTVSRQRLAPFAATRSQARLAELTALLDAGQLSADVERTYPLGEVADALRHFGEQHAQGKIVIQIVPDQ